MMPANRKYKNCQVQNDVVCLQSNTEDKKETAQGGTSCLITKQDMSSGMNSTSALNEKAMQKLEGRLRGLGLSPASEGHGQDSAFVKVLYTLELSLLETQNANILLQRKLTDIEGDRGGDGTIQEKNNNLELENLNLLSMFNLVQARLSEVYERFCGSGTITRTVKSPGENCEKLKVKLQVSQQTVELQEKLKTLTTDLKQFQDKEVKLALTEKEDNVQFLALTTTKLHARVEDLTIQIKELTSRNSVYERELQAANKAIRGYRNTSEAKRLKGVNENNA